MKHKAKRAASLALGLALAIFLGRRPHRGV